MLEFENKTKREAVVNLERVEVMSSMKQTGDRQLVIWRVRGGASEKE